MQTVEKKVKKILQIMSVGAVKRNYKLSLDLFQICKFPLVFPYLELLF